MSKYIDSKIYKIIDNTNQNIYIGSTIQSLRQRLSGHEHDARKYKDGYGCGSQDIIKNGDYKIELVEAVPCESLQELHKHEQKWIDRHQGQLVNKICSYKSKEQKEQDRKLLYLKNRDKILQDKKIYDSMYIQCPCGSGYSMSHRARHLSTKKCINFHKDYYLNKYIYTDAYGSDNGCLQETMP